MNNLIKKLLYRSNHRGTKEMDLLIGTFAKENLDLLNQNELFEFESFLNFTDREISSWLINNTINLEIDKLSVSKKIKNFKLKF
jgi:antitoxin CptB